MVIGWPTISSARYPYSRSAAGFQLVITPSIFFPTMASSEELTIAESSSDSGILRLASVFESGDWPTTTPPPAGPKLI